MISCAIAEMSRYLYLKESFVWKKQLHAVANWSKENCLSRSGTYQVRTSVSTEKQQALLNHVSHSGIILEPSTAGQPPLQPTSLPTTTSGPPTLEKRPTITKVLKGMK